MTVGYCKNCKHWTKHWSEEDNQGVCQRITGQDGCLYPVDLPQGELAQVQATYDVTGAYLVTLPSFGCVLFEDKGE